MKSSVELTALDRCDRCASQAYVLYVKDGLELLFCRHHMIEHNVCLESEGWEPYYDYAALEQLSPTTPVPL